MELRNTFIDEVISRLTQEEADFSQICLLAPSRRAVVYFRNAIARTVVKPVWAPKMSAIQDLLREASGRDFPEDMTLVSQLYGAFESVMQEANTGWQESFASFYAWGSMILKDFDDLDRQLAPVDRVFQNLEELREIDVFFEGESEERDALRWFREALMDEPEPAGLRAKFLGIWGTLMPLYTRFQAQLAEKGWGYDGWAFREAAENLGLDQVFPYQQVIFVGFNALTRAEEKLADRLAEAGKLRMFWDADRMYEPEPEKEAWLGPEVALFVRKYHTRWKDHGSEIIFHDRTTSPATIELIGAPYQVTQALELRRVLGDALNKLEHPEQQAIVLADESLLLPVLKHLPEVPALNITMGFPLKFTAIYQFLMKVLELQATAEPMYQTEEGNTLAPNGFLELLSHPFFLSKDKKSVQEWQKRIVKENILRVSLSQVAAETEVSSLWHAVFREPESGNWPAYFDTLFVEMAAWLANGEDPVEAEIMLELYTRLNLLREVLQHLGQQPDRKGFARLFREVLRTARVPFEGEPLEGLQVMGFLETRVLDFDTVYLLGANEGFLPPTSAGNSFIPFNLRKAYRLPTYEEQDAIASYHFFRLIQRPRRVVIFYNTSIQDTGTSGEISRFLLQIIYFLNRDPLRVSERGATFSPRNFNQPVITVPSSPGIQADLIAKFFEREKGYFSSTALISYLTCPLQFYFNYLANIREEEELTTSLDNLVMGKVMHRVLEKIYETQVGGALEMPADEAIENILQEAYFVELGSKTWSKGGINAIYSQIIHSLIKNQINRDLNDEPFRIRQVEQEEIVALQITDSFRVRVGGKIDRLDDLSTGVRVVDYKSGKIALVSETNQDLEKAFEEGKPDKILFQGMIYAWLLSRKDPPEMPDKVAFYPIGSKDGEVRTLAGHLINAETLTLYEGKIKRLIESIFNQPFKQTTILTNCAYCAYAGICQR